MTDSGRIRPARPDDAPGIRATARESWHAAYDDLLDPDTVESVTDAWYALERLRGSIDSDDSHLFVVDDSDDREDGQRGDPFGFVHVSSWADDPDVGHLARLYVRSSHWGNGLGTALLERGERALATDGYDRIRLEVFAENERAIAFYRDRGYEPAGEVTEELEGETYRVSLLEKPL